MENLNLNAGLIFTFGTDFVRIPKSKPCMSLSRWDCNGFLAGTFLFIMQVFLGNWGFCWAGARLAAGDYPQFKGLLALFPTPCLSMSLSTWEPGVCPADHGGAHAACVVCLSPPSRVRLGALKKSSPWEFLPPVASCCSLLARIAPPILSSHQPPPLGRFHIG